MATSSPLVAYLDSSALVKLIAREPETTALRQELARWTRRVSSSLAAIEVTRTPRRLGPRATLAPRVLAGLQLFAIDPIAPTAMHIGGTLLRSLDALHLATAVSIMRAEPVVDALEMAICQRRPAPDWCTIPTAAARPSSRGPCNTALLEQG